MHSGVHTAVGETGCWKGETNALPGFAWTVRVGKQMQ